MANRCDVFSNLKSKFESWLPEHGVSSASSHYVAQLEAIGMPVASHVAVGAKWCGFYEVLTGKKPQRGVFDVWGLDDFLMIYGDAAPLLTAKQADKESLRPLYRSCADYDTVFAFARSSSTSGDGDGGHTRCGYTKYLQFLSELELEVDDVSAEGVLPEPIQKIVYGAPGTGKSHGTEGLIEKYGIPIDRVFRTTFHPDSDYSTFVGAYKPTTDKGTQKIVYSFRPQAFMNAYVKAWEDVSKPVVLVIEEINRGHCAQIFGDLFQLLDRRADGYSRYPITPDTDLASWLVDKVPDATTLKLPPNLYIWATMNTSDQSLFPIDSAFKRRWDWKYVPIREGKHKDGPKKGQPLGWKIDVGGEKYDWWKFLGCINTLIYKTTESEDKKLGYFFVKPDVASAAGGDKDIISADRFVDKVVFYLWNDVFKDYGVESVFKNEQIEKKNGDEDGQAVAFERFFVEDGDKADPKVLAAFFEALKFEPDTTPIPPAAPAAQAAAPGPVAG